MKLRLAIVILGVSLGLAAKWMVAAIEGNSQPPKAAESAGSRADSGDESSERGR